jgi:hypothetical protein
VGGFRAEANRGGVLRGFLLAAVVVAVPAVGACGGSEAAAPAAVKTDRAAICASIIPELDRTDEALKKSLLGRGRKDDAAIAAVKTQVREHTDRVKASAAPDAELAPLVDTYSAEVARTVDALSSADPGKALAELGGDKFGDSRAKIDVLCRPSAGG